MNTQIANPRPNVRVIPSDLFEIARTRNPTARNIVAGMKLKIRHMTIPSRGELECRL